MKVVGAKDLQELLMAMRMVEADERYAISLSASTHEVYDHMNTAAIYQVIREKLENLPVFEV